MGRMGDSSDVPHVGFVVLAHHLPEQLERLLDALASPSSLFYVHIDRRAPTVVRSQVRARLGSRTDVTLLPSRRTKWGEFGIVLATLDGLKAARQHGAETVVVLTGQDYPIKPTREVLSFLDEHRGQSFVYHVALPRADWPPPGGMERLTARGFRLLGREWLWKDAKWNGWLPQRQVDMSPRKPVWGSALYTLDAGACDYLVDHLLTDDDLLRLFRLVQFPDEMAIHTVLANSPLRDTLINDDLTFDDWSANGPHPEVLTPDHMEGLRSSPALFARKFDMRRHPGLLDLVDQRLRSEPPAP